MHIPQEPVCALLVPRSLKPSLSPFNLHSVLSCDQKAGAGRAPSKGRSLLLLPTAAHAWSHAECPVVPRVGVGL